MNFRLTAILLGLLAAALVGLLAFLFLSSDKETPDVALDGLVGVKPDEIDSVELKRTQPREETLSFFREKGGAWQARAPVVARLDQGQVNELVRDLLAAKPATHPDLANDPKTLGLEKPTVEVTLRKGSDRSATLRIGNTSLGGKRAVTFVATGADPGRPFAVPAASLAGLFKDGTQPEGEAWKHAKSLIDFRSRAVFSVSGPQPTDAKALKLKRGKSTVALEKEKTGTWAITEPAGMGEADVGGDPGTNPGVFTGVRPLVSFLVGLAAGGPNDFIESPSPADEKAFGLDPDDPDVVRIDYTPTTGPTEILYVGKVVDEKDKTAPTVRYAKMLGDSAVMKLRTDRIDALTKTIADPGVLRNHDLVPDTDREFVDAIDLTVGATTVSLRKVAKGKSKVWVLLGGSGDPPDANRRVVDELLFALTKPRTIIDFPAPPADAFAPASLSGMISVWVNGLEGTTKPDEKPKGTPIVLTIGKPDKDGNAFVRKVVGNRTTIGRVPAAIASLAAKTRLDFVDPKIPSFATNSVVRFAYSREKETVELEKEDKLDAAFPLGKWTWSKPEGMKGKVADAVKVQNLLAVAATLSPGAVVAEAPGEADLLKYGLDPKAGPRMTVTVYPGKDVKPTVYEFGAETPDGGFIYARHGGSAVVYTIPRVVFDRFRTDDLSPAPPPVKAETAPMPRVKQ